MVIIELKEFEVRMTKKNHLYIHFNRGMIKNSNADESSASSRKHKLICLLLTLGLQTITLPSFAENFLPATEAECSFSDLRTDFNLKMRNQQETSWCFAHAASDLLQFTYKIPVQISAADIAINYSQSRVSKLIHFFKKIFGSKDLTPAETGFIKFAIQKIIPQGYCPESALPSEKWLKENPTGKDSEVEITAAIIEIVELQKQIQQGKYQSAEALPWHYRFKNISRSDFFSILKNSTFKNLFAEIRNYACKNERVPFPDSTLNPVFQLKSHVVMNSIHQSLAEHQAVTIDFFGDVLRHYENPKRRVSELHTVLVYGQKYNHITGECMLLIKDSYGEQCVKYDPKIECENGNVWLSESKIYRSMTSTLRFK